MLNVNSSSRFTLPFISIFSLCAISSYHNRKMSYFRHQKMFHKCGYMIRKEMINPRLEMKASMKSAASSENVKWPGSAETPPSAIE